MRQAKRQPYYEKIAIDIASRIANEEFDEGMKLFGKSAMSSQYKTSSETIRRALRLLSDMKVVEVKPQSGVVVLSKDNAKRYYNNATSNESIKELFDELLSIKNEYEALNNKLSSTMDQIAQSSYSFADAAYPLPNYEIRVPDDSILIGRNIGELDFWQQTGATIIAIRRGNNVIISPGPTAELYERDIIILIGDKQSLDTATRLIESKGGTK